MAHLDAWIKTFTCTWRDIDPFPKSSSALYATAKQRKWPRDDATSCSQFVSIVSASTYTQGYTSSCMCLDYFNHLPGCFHSVDMAVVWPQCLPSVAFHVHKSQLLWLIALRGQKKDCSLINPETFKSIWLLLVLGLLLTISSMAKQPLSLSVVQLFLWSNGA